MFYCSIDILANAVYVHLVIIKAHVRHDFATLPGHGVVME